jgi:hypothetical protein
MRRLASCAPFLPLPACLLCGLCRERLITASRAAGISPQQNLTEHHTQPFTLSRSHSAVHTQPFTLT